MKKLLILFFIVALVAICCVFVSQHTLKACYTFEFGEDKLDLGDELNFFGNAEGAGFINVGNDPQASRTLCFDARIHTRTVLSLLFGPSPTFSIVEGSADIVSVHREIVICSLGPDL